MNDQERKVKVSTYQKAKKNNVHCGDSYFYTETKDAFLCVLVDGLGSGVEAQESADIVINIIKYNFNVSVENLVNKCNEQLLGKRGVVLGILKLDFSKETYTFSSIGNIGIMSVNGCKKRRNIPSFGYLSGKRRSFKIEKEILQPEMKFFMFTDGVLDKELSEKYFFNSEVQEIIETYAKLSEEERDDDTTLIAISYHG